MFSSKSFTDFCWVNVCICYEVEGSTPFFACAYTVVPCSLSSASKDSACNAGDPGSISGNWIGKIYCRRDRLPTPVFLGFSGGSAGKESTCNVGDLGSIPGLGRSPGEGNSYPLQYSGLENSMDCIVHGAAESRTRLSAFHFHVSFPELFVEKPIFPLQFSWKLWQESIYHICQSLFLDSQLFNELYVYVVLYCLDYSIFILSFELGNVDPPTSFFF